MARPTSGSARMDPDSAEWVRALCVTGQERQEAQGRLHAMLLRAARAEMSRRAPRTRLAGPEADDFAHQAAADTMEGVLAKLEQFRGDSLFTTWAYKFVILEVSTKIGRHFWGHPTVPMDGEDWDRLPDRFGFAPEEHAQWRATVDALRDAVERDLTTTRQRRVFVALVVQGVPLDALVLLRRPGRGRRAGGAALSRDRGAPAGLRPQRRTDVREGGPIPAPLPLSARR